MKRLLHVTAMVVLVFSIFPTAIFAQSPDMMSYQAVVRDANNALVENQLVSMRISILQGSVDGPAVFVETHSISSNVNGLVSLAIGNGNVISGNMAGIDWGNDVYFIKTETDPNGGTDYSITGTSQMLTVPYAMHSKTAESLTSPIEEADPIFENSASAGIMQEDIDSWDDKIDTEVDPTFQGSAAAGIDPGDIDNWDNKLDSETDPLFQGSPASGIMTDDIDNWNNSIDAEADPLFQESAAAGILAGDIDSWNDKLDAEVDGDVTNELQQLSVSGDTIFISDGNYILLPGLSNLSELLPGPTVQQRIDEGETPLDIYNSDNALLDSLYGSYYEGGLICYFDVSDGSGLVCSETDQTPNMHWYNCVYTNTGATLSDIGTGEFNTGLIIADQGFGFYAASICDIAEDGGFEDWFLPSKDELEQMYLNLHAAGKGAFDSDVYWSSTEDDNLNAWSMDFSMGIASSIGKFLPQNVRAVRVFE